VTSLGVGGQPFPTRWIEDSDNIMDAGWTDSPQRLVSAAAPSRKMGRDKHER
jgi:hypothetical protein